MFFSNGGVSLVLFSSIASSSSCFAYDVIKCAKTLHSSFVLFRVGQNTRLSLVETPKTWIRSISSWLNTLIQRNPSVGVRTKAGVANTNECQCVIGQ